jgi:2-polyprenyl-3-methyl-5-hydroxy-6-metoxy-1,4-benzoquinol methylase
VTSQVPVPRWFTDTAEGHSDRYVERFRSMAAEGADLAGEARLVDALIAPGSRVLDAGCGPGRLGGELHRRGHVVVGVDADPVLIAAAEADHAGPTWLVEDLTQLDLGDEHAPFDLAVLAGNVMVFVAPVTEADVLSRVAAHLVPGGRLVIGFRTGDVYPLERFDSDLAEVGLVLEQRFATWDLVPYAASADFAVSLLRTPA